MIVLTLNQVRFVRACVGTMMILHAVSYFQARQLAKEYDEMIEKYKKLHNLTTYLVSVCEEQDVDFSEFDLIALGLIVEGETNV